MKPLEIVIVLILIGLFTMFVAQMAYAAEQDIQWTWDHSIEREDGSALLPEERSLYNLYKIIDGEATFVASVPGTETTAMTTETSGGEHCYQISTVDTDSLEGNLSDPACVTVKFPAKAPMNLTGSKL